MHDKDMLLCRFQDRKIMQDINHENMNVTHRSIMFTL